MQCRQEGCIFSEKVVRTFRWRHLTCTPVVNKDPGQRVQPCFVVMTLNAGGWGAIRDDGGWVTRASPATKMHRPPGPFHPTATNLHRASATRLLFYSAFITADVTLDLLISNPSLPLHIDIECREESQSGRKIEVICSVEEGPPMQLTKLEVSGNRLPHAH